MKCKGLHTLTFILLIIGGLNWLVWGIWQWEIGLLFGDSFNITARVIYIAIGLSAIYELFTNKSYCKSYDKGGGHHE